MNILVTGGAGFIGSHTVERILEKFAGSTVIVVDNLYAGSLSNLPVGDRGLIYLRRDIRRLDDVLDAVRERGLSVDAVLHLAAVVGVDEVYRNPYHGVTVNIGGTAAMLELSRRLDASRFVYASSAAVYGDPVRVPVSEDDPPRPSNLYGETKYGGERLVEMYRRDYGLSTISLRYFNVYGPRMRPGPYSGVIYKFVKALLSREAPVIYGDGSQTRDFVYVADVAEANIRALITRRTGVYNIGTGTETSINELYGLICGLIGYCPEPVRMGPRRGDVRRSVADISRASVELGWRPRVGLREGLAETVRYYRDFLAMHGW